MGFRGVDNLYSIFHRQGKRIVDLSADFRLKDAAVYEKWYQKHTSADLLRESVYGLPELHREKIRNAKIVGNPGCYPTGALIGLIPLMKNGMISYENIVIDAKSGVSGAGAAACGAPVGRFGSMSVLICARVSGPGR
jgi:N-acetyl-gamma-glutamyl-phosphate reductase